MRCVKMRSRRMEVFTAVVGALWTRPRLRNLSSRALVFSVWALSVCSTVRSRSWKAVLSWLGSSSSAWRMRSLPMATLAFAVTIAAAGNCFWRSSTLIRRPLRCARSHILRTKSIGKPKSYNWLKNKRFRSKLAASATYITASGKSGCCLLVRTSWTTCSSSERANML